MENTTLHPTENLKYALIVYHNSKDENGQPIINQLIELDRNDYLEFLLQYESFYCNEMDLTKENNKYTLI